jgi:hypothetical protein
MIAPAGLDPLKSSIMSPWDAGATLCAVLLCIDIDI